VKRFLTSLSVIGLAIAALTTTSFAADLAGTKCTKLGATKTLSGKKFTCIKLGKNLYWSNGVKVSTANYRVGDLGPAGGIIFYAESSVQPWGKYLEVAPNGWYEGMPDPKTSWCDLTEREILKTLDASGLPSQTGNEIGKGKANTRLMSNLCESGAANLATEYRGGGKSDWFLPSLAELNQLCKFARGQKQGIGTCQPSGNLSPGFSNYYWSSSEVDEKYAWDRFFNIGNSNMSTKDFEGNAVRPIRAF
jgi:hypothetical protein